MPARTNESRPPTDSTAKTASTMVPPIATTNWKAVGDDHTPETGENRCRRGYANSRMAAFHGLMSRVTLRMVTMARVTQPMMMRLIGMAR